MPGARSGVADGHYLLGFFPPLLDSLGVEPPLRDLSIVRLPVHPDVAIPSATRLRAAICGTRSALDSTAGVVVGTVRSAADGAPLAGVTVAGAWTELSFTAGVVVRHAPRIMAITTENGWFALCNVPRGGLMLRVATRAPTVRRVSSSRRRTTNSCAASSRWAGAGASRWSAACARSPTATCSPERSCASTADHRPAPTTAANSPSPRFAWSSQRAWQCSTRPR